MDSKYQAKDDETHLLIIMGVSGCGKTTIGQKISEKFHYRFVDGDTYHSDEAKQKMSHKIPLTDQDRAPWLLKLSNMSTEWMKEDINSVLACSALKKEYRDILRKNKKESQVVFLFLKTSRDIIEERLEHRQGHFMPAALMDSQFETLEEPKYPDENVVVIDVDKHPDDIIDDIVAQLKNERGITVCSQKHKYKD